MKKNIYVLLLTSLVAACGGTDLDTESITDSNLSGRKTAPSRFVCTRSSTIVGVCEESPNSSLYPELDDAWKIACESAGFDIDPCSGGQCAGSVNCVDNSVLFHDCDKEFSTGCADAGGTFTCTDWFGDDCREGTCKIP